MSLAFASRTRLSATLLTAVLILGIVGRSSADDGILFGDGFNRADSVNNLGSATNNTGAPLLWSLQRDPDNGANPYNSNPAFGPDVEIFTNKLRINCAGTSLVPSNNNDMASFFVDYDLDTALQYSATFKYNHLHAHHYDTNQPGSQTAGGFFMLPRAQGDDFPFNTGYVIRRTTGNADSPLAVYFYNGTGRSGSPANIPQASLGAALGDTSSLLVSQEHLIKLDVYGAMGNLARLTIDGIVVDEDRVLDNFYNNEVPDRLLLGYNALGTAQRRLVALIDDLVVIPNLSPVITLVSPTNGTLFYPAANGLEFTVMTLSPNTIAPEDIQLFLNDVQVPGGSLTVGGTPTNRTVSTGVLQTNTFYTARIVATDDEGRQSVKIWTFDTIDESASPVFEAENFNFDGGQYINDPVLSLDFESTNSYYGKGWLIGIQGVDFLESNTNRPTGGVVGEWRYLGGTNTPQTIDSKDYVRNVYATNGSGIPDFDLVNIVSNEWWNYTYDFGASNNYKVYVRGRAAAAQTVKLLRVTSDPTQPNQTTMLLGNFVVTSNRYTYTPLRGGDGSDLVVDLSGAETLRMQAVTANTNLFLNYVLFVPTTNPATVLGPVVDTTFPADGAVNTRRDVTITAPIVNRETVLAPASVELFLNNVEVTPTVTPTSEGADVSYAVSPDLTPGAVQTVRVEYEDTLGNPYEYEWSFTTSADVQSPQLVLVRGGIDTAGQLRVLVRFSEPLDAATSLTLGNYTINGGVTLTNVEAGLLSTEVKLAGNGASLGQNLTLTVNNVEDVSGNVIAPNSTANFLVGVFVPNWSFEEPVLLANTAEVTAPGNMGPGWTVTFEAGSINNFGVVNPAIGHFAQVNPLPAPFDLNQLGFINLNQTNSIGRADSDIVGTLLTGQDYTLRIVVGARAGGSYNITYSIGLVTVGGQELGTFATTNLVSGPAGSTTIREVTYALTANEASAFVGQGYSIRIRGVRNSTGFSQMTFDKVRLEPGLPLVPFPLINPERQGQTFSVSFQSQNGRQYWLEYNNSLTTSNWTALAPVAGTGGVLELIDSTATVPTRFYRVAAE